jgi:hypothetical protein
LHFVGNLNDCKDQSIKIVVKGTDGVCKTDHNI